MLRLLFRWLFGRWLLRCLRRVIVEAICSTTVSGGIIRSLFIGVFFCFAASYGRSARRKALLHCLAEFGRIAAGALFLLLAASECNGQSEQSSNGERNSLHVEPLSKSLWNGVVGVGRQEHILREVDLHAMSLPYRDRARNLHETVQDGVRRLRDAGRGAGGECLGTAGRDGAAAFLNFSRSGNHTQGDRSAEDL